MGDFYGQGLEMVHVYSTRFQLAKTQSLDSTQLQSRLANILELCAQEKRRMDPGVRPAILDGWIDHFQRTWK